MKRSFLLFFASAMGAALLALAPALAPAQQVLTWDQVKTKFEAANPTLKADALGVDEMKAEEITAYPATEPPVHFVDGRNSGRSLQRDLAAAQRHPCSTQRQLSA